jgi:hypothetical protein
MCFASAKAHNADAETSLLFGGRENVVTLWLRSPARRDVTPRAFAHAWRPGWIVVNLQVAMRTRVFLLVAVWPLLQGGCSFAFSQGPPADHRQLLAFGCSSSLAMPITDSVMAALFALATLGAANDEAAPPTAPVAMGAMAVAFVASARHGLVRRSACEKAQTDLALRLRRDGPDAGGVAAERATGPEPGHRPPATALSPFASARFGALSAVSSADGSNTALGMFGLSLGLGLGRWKLEAISETSGPSKRPYGFRALGLGALFLPFDEKLLLPYAAMSLRWSFTQLGGRGAEGLVILPGLGLLVPLTDSGFLSLRGELGYFVNTFRESAPDRLMPERRTANRGHGLTFLLGAVVQP